MKSDQGHKHELEQLFWGRNVHSHSFSTRTSPAKQHTHRVSGTTSAALGDGAQHVHRYEGVTSFDNGHAHRFQGVTGPAVPLPDGGHTHELVGETSFDNGHDHLFLGSTGKCIW